VNSSTIVSSERGLSAVVMRVLSTVRERVVCAAGEIGLCAGRGCAISPPRSACSRHGAMRARAIRQHPRRPTDARIPRIGGVAGGGRLADYGVARRARAARTIDASPPTQAMAFSEKRVVTRYVVSWSGLWRSRKKARRASRVTD